MVDWRTSTTDNSTVHYTFHAHAHTGPLNIDEYPGAELLSGNEKELCAALRLLPKHYLYIKVRTNEQPPPRWVITPPPVIQTQNDFSPSPCPVPACHCHTQGRILRDAEGMGLLTPAAPNPANAAAAAAGSQGAEGGAAVVTMDVVKTKGVYDFLVRVGWVSRAAAKGTCVRGWMHAYRCRRSDLPLCLVS